MSQILDRRPNPRPALSGPAATVGWATAADLTPPEVNSRRRLHRIRQRILMAALLVMLLGATGFAYAFVQVGAARSDLSSANSTTRDLHAQQQRFSGVTKLKGNIAQIRQQIAQLMAHDVDVTALLNTLRAAQPNGVAIQQLTITFSDGTANTAQNQTGQSLDTSGKAHIGTIALTATGRTMNDASRYVLALTNVPGLVDVTPTSNTTQAVGTTFTLNMGITDALFSHRFESQPTKGGTR